MVYYLCMSKHAEDVIKKVNATLSLEGLPLSEEDKLFIADFVDGKYSMEEAVAILNARFAINEH